VIGGGIRHARSQFDSPYGRIRSGWRMQGKRFRWNVTIPANTTAQVRLPARESRDVRIDGKSIAQATGVSLSRTSVRGTEIKLVAGTDAIVVRPPLEAGG
jgi:alpha-L-rhamnosidase